MNSDIEEQKVIDVFDGVEWMGCDIKVNKVKFCEECGGIGGIRCGNFYKVE